MFSNAHSTVWADAARPARSLAFVVVPPGALRLIFAATVVVAHYALLSGHRIPAPIDGVAVNGFFVLSGYWIAHLWDKTYSKLPVPIPTFYISRAWRIYPLAILGTLAMVPLVEFHVGGSTMVPNLALVGLRMQRPILNPPEWSLAVEMQFYLLAPLLLVLVRSARWLWALLAIGTIFWLRFAFEEVDSSLAVFLVFFLAGILYARHPMPQTAARFALGGLAVFLVFGLLVIVLPPMGAGTTYLRFYILALTIAIIPYTALSVTKISSKTDRMLGDLAFPVYIAHWPVFVVVSGLVNHWVAPAMLATLVVSLLLWAFVDRPLERRRRAFVDRQRVAPAPAPTGYDSGLAEKPAPRARIRRLPGAA